MATFQSQTPSRLGAPRRTITAIDTALGHYIAAVGHAKLPAVNALINAIAIYQNTPGRDPARRGAVAELLAEAQLELVLLNALGPANGGLFDDLVERAGGIGKIVPLINLVTAITTAHAAQLPNLISLAGGAPNLDALQAAILAINPNNSFLLAGLIPQAGGPASLPAITGLATHIQPANAFLLLPLIQLIPNLGHLDALIQAVGVPHVRLIETMTADAGGAASAPHLTAAINLHHAGNGNLAVDLTKVAAGDPVRFQQLTGMLQHFIQAAPVPHTPPLQAEVDAYNATLPLPFNRHITEIAFGHFLQRHTMRYFSFAAANIDAVNDQWPFTEAATAGQVQNVLIAALTHIRSHAPRANWFLSPNAAQDAPAGGFTSRVGVMPADAQAQIHGRQIRPVRLGQFFPVHAGGGGVIPMDRAAMNAVHLLL